MKNPLILSILIFTFFSCSKELTFEEKFEGQWTGLLTQKDCCTFDMNVTISQLILGQNVASGDYTNADYSICNNDIFDCERGKTMPADCGFNWNFSLSQSSSVMFIETPLGEVCAPGIITLKLINDDMISVDWIDVIDADNTASGSLKRK
jgi:hypothetical protein